MLNWFKKRGAPPNVGPDYQHIDSREKAEDLYRRGDLTKLLLLPPEFGGQDIPPNVVYVPAFAAQLKARIDQNTIKPLAQKGQVRRYTATPEYEGTSVIPSLIRISATDPGRFEGSISIWGKAVQNGAAQPASAEEAVNQPAFTPAGATEALGPEDLVRAFIADYDKWNKFAYQSRWQGPGGSLAAANTGYDALLREYCPPGHEHCPIAFGSDSNHDIARETIVSAEFAGDRCVVKTRQTKRQERPTIVQDYEYHLEKSGQRWFLTSILHVVANGKYEGL